MDWRGDLRNHGIDIFRYLHSSIHLTNFRVDEISCPGNQPTHFELLFCRFQAMNCIHELTLRLKMDFRGIGPTRTGNWNPKGRIGGYLQALSGAGDPIPGTHPCHGPLQQKTSN